MNQTPNESPTESQAVLPPTETPNTGEESDFIDFYQVLGLPPQTDTTQLNNRIIELYNEAQNNHDHRNPSKRLHYDAMCELLPYVRIVLLQPDKRARYDSYLSDYQSNTAGLPEFESIIKEIIGRPTTNSEDITDVIALTEEPVSIEAAPIVAETLAPAIEPVVTQPPVVEPTVAPSTAMDQESAPVSTQVKIASAQGEIHKNGVGSKNGVAPSDHTAREAIKNLVAKKSETVLEQKKPKMPAVRPVVVPLSASSEAPKAKTFTDEKKTVAQREIPNRTEPQQHRSPFMTSAVMGFGAALIVGALLLIAKSPLPQALLLATVVGALAGLGAYIHFKKLADA